MACQPPYPVAAPSPTASRCAVIGVCQGSVTTSTRAGPGAAQAVRSAAARRPGFGDPLAGQPEGPRHVGERHVGEVLVLPAAAEVDPPVPADPAERPVVQHDHGDRQAQLGDGGKLADRVPHGAVPGQHHGAAAGPGGGHADRRGQRVPEAGLPARAEHLPPGTPLLQVGAAPAAGQAGVTDEDVVGAEQRLDLREYPLRRDGDRVAGPFRVPVGAPAARSAPRSGTARLPGPVPRPAPHGWPSRAASRPRSPGRASASTAAATGKARPSSAGSRSSCTTAWPGAGSVQPNVGPLPALVPQSSTTSASASAAAAAEVPMLPVTPTDSGWSSAIAPLPDSVVPTAADRALGQRGQLRARARVQHSPAGQHERPLPPRAVPPRRPRRRRRRGPAGTPGSCRTGPAPRCPRASSRSVPRPGRRGRPAAGTARPGRAGPWWPRGTPGGPGPGAWPRPARWPATWSPRQAGPPGRAPGRRRCGNGAARAARAARSPGPPRAPRHPAPQRGPTAASPRPAPPWRHRPRPAR